MIQCMTLYELWCVYLVVWEGRGCVFYISSSRTHPCNLWNLTGRVLGKYGWLIHSTLSHQKKSDIICKHLYTDAHTYFNQDPFMSKNPNQERYGGLKFYPNIMALEGYLKEVKQILKWRLKKVINLGENEQVNIHQLKEKLSFKLVNC